MYSYGPPHMAVQKQDDQHEHTFSSYVRIRDAILKTYLGRWTIGRSGERGSGISVLPARDDDDDDDLWFKIKLIFFKRIGEEVLIYGLYFFCSLLRVFHTSISRWFLTGVQVTTSLLKSPGFFSVFWLISIM